MRAGLCNNRFQYQVITFSHNYYVFNKVLRSHLRCSKSRMRRVVFKQQMFSWLTVRSDTELISRNKIFTFSWTRNTDIRNNELGMKTFALAEALVFALVFSTYLGESLVNESSPSTDKSRSKTGGASGRTSSFEMSAPHSPSAENPERVGGTEARGCAG